MPLEVASKSQSPQAFLSLFNYSLARCLFIPHRMNTLLVRFPPPRAQCDFFPPALTVTPSRERAAEKGYLSTEAFQYSLSSRACVPVCVFTVSASVLEEQGHRELMQRDEAKFSSLQYLSAQARERHLLYFHTRPLPQRARGRCSGRMCIK